MDSVGEVIKELKRHVWSDLDRIKQECDINVVVDSSELKQRIISGHLLDTDRPPLHSERAFISRWECESGSVRC